MVITIQGEITPKTVEEIRAQLVTEEPIELHIDSIGGDLFAGLAIYNLLQSRDVSVFIDGVAGSVASVIALAGDKPPKIASTGSIVIHNAHADNIKGNQHDVQKVANSLAKYSEIVAQVYEAKTGLNIDDIKQLMNEETVFDSRTAIETGFAGDVYNKISIFSKINKIDMKLIDQIKASLAGAPVENEITETETTTEETTGSEVLSPEQEEAIRAIVGEMLAEAMTGTPTVEEVGNTIATVLNSIVSEGTPPTREGLNVAEPNKTTDGVTSFYKKMKEIKNKTSKK